MLAPDPDLDRRVQLVRRFNRLYTQRIGVLEPRYLHRSYSLTHARVLYELAQRSDTTASELGAKLGVDAGYLSRIVKRFEKDALVVRTPAPQDGRQSLLNLTRRGRALFARFEERASAEMRQLIAELPETGQQHLVTAMAQIEKLLAAQPETYSVRTQRAGDLGFIVHRHGVLYAREYGWDARFEALVAEVVAKFIRDYDERYDRCWVAERAGEIVGSVLVRRASKHVAQLRLLLVEPSARGLGIGRQLAGECVRFARAAGYHTLELWTNDVLHSARRIYEAAGFQLVAQEKNQLFGEGLTGQTWALELTDTVT